MSRKTTVPVEATLAPVETSLYPQVTNACQNVADYAAVLFTVCDVFGRPRGKFAYGGNIERFIKNGVETSNNTCVLGLYSENSSKLQSCSKKEAVTYRMFPDITTLAPLSWLCKDGKKVGHMLCDLFDTDGQLSVNSARAKALNQLQILQAQGFQILSAFETEYTINLKGKMNAYGGDYCDLVNMVRLDTDILFYYDHIMELLASGIPVEAHMEEWAPGQIEYSMQPQFGIKMADSVHRLRYVSKSICDKKGLEPVFMTKPREDAACNGFHLNHSLWTLDGINAFYDQNKSDKCSDVMHHWIAGLIQHGNALTALMCPTVNCYKRLHNAFAPSDNIWNYNDRMARMRVKNKGTNIYIEDRTPSSACNPYLCLAGLIAAGVDGIIRKLEYVPPKTFRPLNSGHESAKSTNPLPKTLEEALQALEQDSVLVHALGEDFIQNYVTLCKEFQLEKLTDFANEGENENLDAQRDLFLRTL